MVRLFFLGGDDLACHAKFFYCAALRSRSRDSVSRSATFEKVDKTFDGSLTDCVRFYSASARSPKSWNTKSGFTGLSASMAGVVSPLITRMDVTAVPSARAMSV